MCSSSPASFRSRFQALVEQSLPEWNLSNAQSTASCALRQGPEGPERSPLTELDRARGARGLPPGAFVALPDLSGRDPRAPSGRPAEQAPGRIRAGPRMTAGGETPPRAQGPAARLLGRPRAGPPVPPHRRPCLPAPGRSSRGRCPSTPGPRQPPCDPRDVGRARAPQTPPQSARRPEGPRLRDDPTPRPPRPVRTPRAEVATRAPVGTGGERPAGRAPARGENGGCGSVGRLVERSPC